MNVTLALDQHLQQEIADATDDAAAALAAYVAAQTRIMQLRSLAALRAMQGMSPPAAAGDVDV